MQTRQFWVVPCGRMEKTHCPLCTSSPAFGALQAASVTFSGGREICNVWFVLVTGFAGRLLRVRQPPVWKRASVVSLPEYGWAVFELPPRRYPRPRALRLNWVTEVKSPSSSGGLLTSAISLCLVCGELDEPTQTLFLRETAASFVPKMHSRNRIFGCTLNRPALVLKESCGKG
jgi:hypothetical protein